MLYGVFAPAANVITTYDAAEQHNTKIKADADYFTAAIREPMKHLAVRVESDGNEKRYLPIMPAFNYEALSDAQVDALLSYLYIKP